MLDAHILLLRDDVTAFLKGDWESYGVNGDEIVITVRVSAAKVLKESKVYSVTLKPIESNNDQVVWDADIKIVRLSQVRGIYRTKYVIGPVKFTTNTKG